MPQISGYKLCKMECRSQKLKDIPVVMLTGREGRIDKLRAKIVGAVQYLTKPFAPHQLIEVLVRDNCERLWILLRCGEQRR